jgi:hypothetical protein
MFTKTMIQQLREAAEAGRKRQRHQAAHALLQAGKAARPPAAVFISYATAYTFVLRCELRRAPPCCVASNSSNLVDNERQCPSY